MVLLAPSVAVEMVKVIIFAIDMTVVIIDTAEKAVGAVLS